MSMTDIETVHFLVGAIIGWGIAMGTLAVMAWWWRR